MTKRLFTRAFALVMILACLLAVTSCKLFKKDHVHSYTESSLNPTCTENGKTVFTCSCGDTYSQDNGKPALGHDMKSQKGNPATCTAEGYEAYEACSRCDYNTKVVVPATGHYYSISTITYPTLKDGGNRTMTCVACSDSYSTEIAATGLSLPSGSQLISAIVGELSFYAALDENTTIIETTESDDLSVNNGTKTFTKIGVGEIDFTSGSGSVQGHVRVCIYTCTVTLDGSVDPDLVTPDSYKQVADIYVYFNDNYISVEDLSGNNLVSEKMDLTEAVYTFIFGLLGLQGDDFNEALYTMVQYSEICDDLLAIYGAFSSIQLPETSEEYNKTLEAIAAIVNSEILVITQDANGNTTYKSNLSVLSNYLEIIDGKTLSEYIDFTYGEGSAAALREFAVNIPYLTLKEIANFAISFAENYGADVDAVFSFVDLLIYTSSGSSVNVKYLIDINLNVTIGELIAESNNEKDADKFSDEMSSTIATGIDTIYGYNFDQLFNAAFNGDPNYVDGSGKVFSIIDTLYAAFEEIDEVIIFEMTTNAEGVVTYIYLAYGPVTATVNIDGDNLSLEVDCPDTFNGKLDITSNSIDFALTTPDTTIMSGCYNVVEENGQLVYYADFFYGEHQLLYFDAILNNGEIVKYDLRVDYYELAAVDHYDDNGYVNTTYEERISTILTVNYTPDVDCDIWTIFYEGAKTVVEIRESEGKIKYNVYSYINDELEMSAEFIYESTDVDCFKFEGIVNDGQFDVLKFSYEVYEGIVLNAYYEFSEVRKVGANVYPDEVTGEPVVIEGYSYIYNTSIIEYSYNYKEHCYVISTYDKDGEYAGGATITAEGADNLYVFSLEVPKYMTGNSLGNDPLPPEGVDYVRYYYYTEIITGLVIQIR